MTPSPVTPLRRATDGLGRQPARRAVDASATWTVRGPLWEKYLKLATRLIGAVEVKPGHVDMLRGYLKSLGMPEGLIIGDEAKRKAVRRVIEDFLLEHQTPALEKQNAADAAKHREAVGRGGPAYVPLEPLPVASQVIDDLYTETKGLGVLDKLFEDDSVTDVHVYNWNHVRYLSLDRDALRGTHRMATPFPSRDSYEKIVSALLSEGHMTAKASHPVFKFTINNFLRIHYIGSDISQTGNPVLAIRKYRRLPLSIGTLLDDGTLTPEAAFFLRDVINARISVVLGGPPGSGKTTLMQALLWWLATGTAEIERSAKERNRRVAQVVLPYRNVRERRTIVIEDECEMVLPDWAPVVQLETTRGTEGGTGTMAGLTGNLVWEQPDLIILGEITDGHATAAAVSAMTMGRPVITTTHGQRAADVLLRWQIWNQEVRKELQGRTVEQSLELAVGYVVMLADGFEVTHDTSAPKSMVLSIEEVRREADGQLTTKPVFTLDRDFKLQLVSGYEPRPAFRERGIRGSDQIAADLAARRAAAAARLVRSVDDAAEPAEAA